MIYLYAAIGLIIVLFIVFKLISRKKETELNKKMTEQLNIFKENAVKLKIDLNKVTLKSNNWSEEIVLDNSRSGGLNQFAGRGDLNVETVQHNENVLLINVPYNDFTIEIEYDISMETTTLKMKLALQKETILYVNPNNLEEYYLDMEFL